MYMKFYTSILSELAWEGKVGMTQRSIKKCKFLADILVTCKTKRSQKILLEPVEQLASSKTASPRTWENVEPGRKQEPGQEMGSR